VAVRQVIRKRKKADKEEAYRWRGPDGQVICRRAIVVGDVAAPWVRALPRRRGVWGNGKRSWGFPAAKPSSEVFLVAAVRHRGLMFELGNDESARWCALLYMLSGETH
jgi:hypothetical protein